jgi:hypothetical protein
MCKEVLDRVPPEHRERYISWHETNHQRWFHDPIETEPDFASIMEAVNKEAKAQVDDLERKWEAEGRFIVATRHSFWRRLATRTRHVATRQNFWHFKRRLLKERYGIDWKSPAELTPYWH